MRKPSLFIVVISLCLFCSVQAHPNEENAATASTQAPSENAKELPAKSPPTPEQHIFALATYSLIDPIITGKIGATVGVAASERKSWEIEYLRGSWAVPFYIQDIGSVTDERVSLIVRTAPSGGSFQFSYGLSYFRIHAHLGDALLNRISQGGYPSADLLAIQALGFNIGLGNRWRLAHGITVGVDWVSWAQPLISLERKAAFMDVASNSADRDDVDTALKVFTYFPRVVFLKLQAGVQF